MKSHFKVMRRERKKKLFSLYSSLSLTHARTHTHRKMKERAVRDFFRLFFSSSTTTTIYSEGVLKVQKGETRFPGCLGS